ncbi:MAG: hypothetical protein P8R54_33455 [Myxococcota bacterium]|nr:hypothetical protein [Myxococcota bacterium]
MPEEAALVLAHRQRIVVRQARAARRGVLFAMLVIGVTLSGILPIPAATQSILLALAATLGITRMMRGIWAARVARHLMRGSIQRRRRGPPQLTDARAESADRRAVKALTDGPDDPLVARIRAHGLRQVDRMEALRRILADAALSAALRRPVAEELARVETELEAILSAMGELAGADRSSRQDLLSQLVARLEVDTQLPAGIYAPA